MTKINIVAFHPATGGIATFARHLTESLGGEDAVNLIRVGKQRRRVVNYSGIQFRGVLVADVEDLPTFILLNPFEDQELTAIRLMRKIPCVLVHHCRTSVYGNKVADMSDLAKQIVVIRKALTSLREDTLYLRHPYFRRFPDNMENERTRWAISHSQVVPKKGHDVMLRANRLDRLPEDKKIEIWGTGNNMHRFYVHHVLSKKFPEYAAKPYDDWGPLVSSARYDVDMTDFPLDGGGTQYTFLEAADAGTVPIIRKSWLRVESDISCPENCVVVSDEEELVDALLREPDQSIVENNYELLERHDGSEWRKVAEGYR